MRNEVVKSIARNGLVAAIYFLITYLIAPIAYNDIQVRISECLVLLCFFRKDYTIGLTLGCLIANFGSSMGIWDVIFGTLATLISCLGICFMKHLFLATLIPVIVNGFIVGAELYFVLGLPFWANVGWVALGEAISICLLGYAIFMIFGKKKYFQEALGFNQNLEFKW